jgi:hypothetical protein
MKIGIQPKKRGLQRGYKGFYHHKKRKKGYLYQDLYDLQGFQDLFDFQ